MSICPLQYSISRRLSWSLVLLTLLGLGFVSTVIYSATSMRLRSAQQDTLEDKSRVLSEFVRIACLKGEGELQHKLTLFEPVRGGTRLELRRGDGSLLFRDDNIASFRHQRQAQFTVPAPDVAGGSVSGALAMDVSHDEAMLDGLAITLLSTTLVAAMLTGLAMRWMVWRELRPLSDLAGQTRAMSPQRLDQRLHLTTPAVELQPLMDQFNALMGRLETAYAQLEGFNADVAHELRTPLATLIGETELALSRERSPASLQDTLSSNLEEMQRLSAMVNDMLFLSHADRGAVARRGEPVSLAALVQQVIDFHEAPLEEAGLVLQVEGDATLPVDEPLFKRALSNLIGNATRYALPGSTVLVRIAPGGVARATAGDDAAGAGAGAGAGAASIAGAGAASRTGRQLEHVQVLVQNQGQGIAEQHLPRLFDRFFRGDSSRCCPEQQHHGLGLAIVAAIARMHAGRTVAESSAGVTRVGFTLALH